MDKKENKSKADTAGGLVFVGALMIGIGLGIYYNVTAVGVLVGLCRFHPFWIGEGFYEMKVNHVPLMVRTQTILPEPTRWRKNPPNYLF